MGGKSSAGKKQIKRNSYQPSKYPDDNISETESEIDQKKFKKVKGFFKKKARDVSEDADRSYVEEIGEKVKYKRVG